MHGPQGRRTVSAHADTLWQPTADAVVIGEDRGRQALLVGGVVQSVSVDRIAADDYWHAMVPDVRPRRALLLGAGGGTLIAALHARFGVVPVVAIDSSVQVVALGRSQFYLGLPGVSVVVADAIQFARSCPVQFAFVAVDLYHGARQPREALGRPFLRDLRRLLGDDGSAAINLFQDRRTSHSVARIERVLRVTGMQACGKNVVLTVRGR